MAFAKFYVGLDNQLKISPETMNDIVENLYALQKVWNTHCWEESCVIKDEMINYHGYRCVRCGLISRGWNSGCERTCNAQIMKLALE